MQAEAEALRVQLRSETGDADLLRRQLRRTKAVFANQLFDTRQRALLRLCFTALAALRQAEDGMLVSSPQPPSSVGRLSRLSRRSAPLRAARLSQQTISHSHSPATPCTAATASTTASRSGAHCSAHTPLPRGVRCDGERRAELAASSASTPASTPASAASSALIALAEAEERYEAQIDHLVTSIGRRRERLGVWLASQRGHQLLRLCLHALRAHATERCAGRGVRAGVLIASAMQLRQVARAVLVAWRLAASSAAQMRATSSALSTVVTERLLAAEAHYADLADRQEATRTSLTERLAAKHLVTPGARRTQGGRVVPAHSPACLHR